MDKNGCTIFPESSGMDFEKLSENRVPLSLSLIHISGRWSWNLRKRSCLFLRRDEQSSVPGCGSRSCLLYTSFCAIRLCPLAVPELNPKTRYWKSITFPNSSFITKTSASSNIGTGDESPYIRPVSYTHLQHIRNPIWKLYTGKFPLLRFFCHLSLVCFSRSRCFNRKMCIRDRSNHYYIGHSYYSFCITKIQAPFCRSKRM